jgi:hypothetical protein
MDAKGDFATKEEAAAKSFVQQIEKTNCKQVIFLTGIVNEEKLSKHLSSRLAVENVLSKSKGATNGFACRHHHWFRQCLV